MPRRMRSRIDVKVKWKIRPRAAAREVFHPLCGRSMPLPFSNYSGEILCIHCNRPVVVPPVEG